MTSDPQRPRLLSPPPFPGRSGSVPTQLRKLFLPVASHRHLHNTSLGQFLRGLYDPTTVSRWTFRPRGAVDAALVAWRSRVVPSASIAPRTAMWPYCNYGPLCVGDRGRRHPSRSKVTAIIFSVVDPPESLAVPAVPSDNRRAKRERHAGFLSLERGESVKMTRQLPEWRHRCGATGAAGPARGAYSCGRVHSDRMESALSVNDWAGRPASPAQPSPVQQRDRSDRAGAGGLLRLPTAAATSSECLLNNTPAAHPPASLRAPAARDPRRPAPLTSSR